MYKATISFAMDNLRTYKQGEILAEDFATAEEIADLLQAGYIIRYEGPATTEVDPIFNASPVAELTAEDISNIKPEVITSSTSTYTISSLTGNKSYKLGEITNLTISDTTIFDKETVIYFDSGTTATSISLPASITNIGDVPTMTTTSSVNTGTCEASKSYIIAILNNIAVWKCY